MDIYKKIINKIKKSSFLKDHFIWGMVFFGILFNLIFLYYTKLKLSNLSDMADSALAGFGYEFISDGGGLYRASIFVAIFSILNIIGSKIIYSYDILASYILIASVPILNALYFFGTFVFLS